MLSERVRSGSEAAPWVVDGIKQLEDEIERLREALKDIDSQMRQADRYFLKESTLAALQQKETE